MINFTLDERVDQFKTGMAHRCTQDMITKLKANEYFEAPASVKYHGDYPGGLFHHSYVVGGELQALTNRLGLMWQDVASPYVIGFFHDLCKVDKYQMREGMLRPEYEYADCPLPGHAEKSIILAQQLVPLTDEEIMCIRYHMGAYEKDEWDYYDRAIRKYPNVLYTHMADMIASKIKNI